MRAWAIALAATLIPLAIVLAVFSILGSGHGTPPAGPSYIGWY